MYGYMPSAHTTIYLLPLLNVQVWNRSIGQRLHSIENEVYRVAVSDELIVEKIAFHLVKIRTLFPALLGQHDYDLSFNNVVQHQHSSLVPLMNTANISPNILH